MLYGKTVPKGNSKEASNIKTDESIKKIKTTFQYSLLYSQKIGKREKNEYSLFIQCKSRNMKHMFGPYR